MELTEAIVRTLGVNQEQVRIIINDMKHENYASGGVLRLDRK
jgi:4-oxalocrotonate tautomerase family enzyme